jgi:Pyruvate/2-oxoacid:ferredoxin oxidoreductase delta subunit
MSCQTSPCKRPADRGVATRIERCVHSRHRLAACLRCVQACPVGALRVSESIVVDLEKCTGCGVCTTVCPTGAFEAVSPSIHALCGLVAQKARETKSVTFRCQHHVATDQDKPDAAIPVTCLGRVDESILLAAAVAGAATICLQDGGCGQCERKRGSDVAICATRQVNLLLEQCGHLSRLRVVSQPSAGAALRAAQAERPEALSRRAFFAMLWSAAERAKDRITTAPAQAEEAGRQNRLHPIKTGEEGKYVPARWQRMLESLRAVQRQALAAKSPRDVWAHVSVGKNCRGCQMCAVFCPTGALSKIEMDGKSGLSFTPSRCTGCNLCAEICLQSSIRTEPCENIEKLVNETTEILVLRDMETVESLIAPMEYKFYKMLGLHIPN